MTFTCHGYLFIVGQLPFSFELVLNLTNIWYYQLMYLYDTLTQCFDLYFVICCPSMNHCFIVVEGFVYPRDPRGHVVGGLLPPDRVTYGKLVLGEGTDPEQINP